MRALACFAVAGCIASTDVGAIQRNAGNGLGGSINAHAGIGEIIPNTLALDLGLRGDIAEHNSRFAIGGSALFGTTVGPVDLLGRVGVWTAAASSAPENTVTPTFEAAVFFPLHQTPAGSPPKYGWHKDGVVAGVREDLDNSAYTTVFVGLEVFLAPGY